MAQLISRGVEEVEDCTSVIRTVPNISTVCEATEDNIPQSGAPYASLDDLKQCGGLIMGSPAYFGSIAAPLKHFLDTTSGLWLSGTMSGKPASVFTSASTMHGGHETTLISMMIPLLHHGMVISGIPYTLPQLHHSKTGGSPYGPSHLSGENNENPINADEKALCIATGRRIAELSQKLGR